MATMIESLFGITPEMYQQAQAQRGEEMALRYAKMDPFERANYGLARGGYQLTGALAGALGAEDPELQRISTRNAIARQIDYTDPASMQQGIQALAQAGDTVGAMQLTDVLRKLQSEQALAYQRTAAAQASLLGAQRTQQQIQQAEAEAQERERKRKAQEQAQQIALSGFRPGGETFQVTEDQSGLPAAEITKTTQPASFDIKAVAPKLIALGQVGIDQLETLVKAQALVKDPDVKYEKAGDIWYEVRPGQPPVAIGGVLKKGEKLATRDAQGNWTYANLPGAAAAATDQTGNPITALIQSNAIHPTVVAYATQIASRFNSLDPEDQDKALEKITTLNNSAVNAQANKDFRQVSLDIAKANFDLQRQMLQLRVDDARRRADAAADGKALPVPTINALAKQSDGVVKQQDLLSNFRDNFVGYKFDTVGRADIALALRSDDPNRLALGSWWQGYQDHVNRIRNELFGAALTATEKAEFERAMVTPGMSPQVARENLRRQAESALKAYNKVTSGLLASGYSRTGIESLSPVPLTAPAQAAPTTPTARSTSVVTPTQPAPLPGGATVRRVQ